MFLLTTIRGQAVLSVRDADIRVSSSGAALPRLPVCSWPWAPFRLRTHTGQGWRGLSSLEPLDLTSV